MNQFVENIKRGQGSRPMSKEATQIFAQAIFAEADPNANFPPIDEVPEKDLSFLMGVAIKRIKAIGLPINFTFPALIAAEALTEGNVGKMVTILVDCLTEYQDKVVTVEMLSHLYPMGFYDDRTFEDYIDNHLKPRKVKWAEIY